MPLPPKLVEDALWLFKPMNPNEKLAFIDHNGKEFYMPTTIFDPHGKKFQKVELVNDDPWIPVTERQPKGSPIVFMYCESNQEFSCSHFVLNRAGVPVTHWQPCVAPRRS